MKARPFPVVDRSKYTYVYIHIQLVELMAKIHTTRPHYIRCLKPNDENVADKFHRFRVTEQVTGG